MLILGMVALLFVFFVLFYGFTVFCDRQIAPKKEAR